MNNPEIHITKSHLTGDGSHTLYSERFNQYFHNPNGAIAENRHVFFETPRLKDRLTQSPGFHIFEVGFGTGLNLLILMDLLKKMSDPPGILFRSVEAFPVTADELMNLNYTDLLDPGISSEQMASVFRELKPGMNQFKLNKYITLELFIGTLNQMPLTFAGQAVQDGETSALPEQTSINAIFFDPFSPDVNSDLWTPDVFRKLAQMSDPDVLLSTYGAASAARASMAVAGWSVARAQGALGKREMTVAALDSRHLDDWQRVDEKRLIQRYRNGEFTGRF